MLRATLLLPERPLIRVEVPRFGVIKRHGDGSIDFVSPLPCPYNYGCIPAIAAPDGDPLDAVVLGQRLPPGATIVMPVRAVMGFVDAGQVDLKVICGAAPLSASDRRGLERFFHLYGVAKGALNRLRRRPGPTRCTGWQPWRVCCSQEQPSLLCTDDLPCSSF